MTRKIVYTYIYVCPICGIEVFSTESPEEVGMRVDTCMQCNFKNRFEYIGSVGNKEKRYWISSIKVAFWKFIKRREGKIRCNNCIHGAMTKSFWRVLCSIQSRGALVPLIMRRYKKHDCSCFEARRKR